MKKGIIIALCIFGFLVVCISSSSQNSTNHYKTEASSNNYKSISTSSNSYKASSSKSTCQFKDSNGNRSCSNSATHGQLCDYHFNMLNDTYNSLVGD